MTSLNFKHFIFRAICLITLVPLCFSTTKLVYKQELFWINKLDSANPDIGYNARKNYHLNKNINKTETLTTVWIDKSNLLKFKKKCIDYNFTFKYIINRTIELINIDNNFIDTYYISSGSLN